MNKKWIFISIAAVLVLLGVYMLISKQPFGFIKGGTKSSGFWPMGKGSPDTENIKKLQAALGITVDGIFGPQTEMALEKQTGKKTITESEFKKLVS